MIEPPPYNGNQAYYWDYTRAEEHEHCKCVNNHRKVPPLKQKARKKRPPIRSLEALRDALSNAPSCPGSRNTVKVSDEPKD